MREKVMNIKVGDILPLGYTVSLILGSEEVWESDNHEWITYYTVIVQMSEEY